MSTIIGNPIMLGGGGGISAPIIGKDFNWTGGDGTYQVLDDGDGNWRIKFLTSGVFRPLKALNIDVFLVGGGGGGAEGGSQYGAGGGGGGYTNTTKSVNLIANTSYNIVVGAGGPVGSAGGQSSAFGASAAGGNGGSRKILDGGVGGAGGSGGGSGHSHTTASAGAGGSDGGNGGGSYGTAGGAGQGTTTREFGESSGTLYAGGGGAFCYDAGSSGIGGAGGGGNGGATGYAGTENTGGGGGAGEAPGAGGGGIVIVRKHKEAVA